MVCNPIILSTSRTTSEVKKFRLLGEIKPPTLICLCINSRFLPNSKRIFATLSVIKHVTKYAIFCARLDKLQHGSSSLLQF